MREMHQRPTPMVHIQSHSSNEWNMYGAHHGVNGLHCVEYPNAKSEVLCRQVTSLSPSLSHFQRNS